MIKKIKAWFKRHIDYRIVKTYFELDKKSGHYVTKHVKKYYFKK